MINQFKKEKINNYQFVKAVDGRKIKESNELKNLFEGNDFNYSKGIIGCTLSHMKLWYQLIYDVNNNFYVIIEDDVSLLPNLKTNLIEAVNTLVTNQLDFLILGERKKYHPNIKNKKDKYFLNNHNFSYISFGYIISKEACKKIIEFNNKCSIKCAIDNPNSYGNIINCYNNYKYLVFVNEDNISDITINDCFKFDDSLNYNKEITYSFTDWWIEEYCGGNFDFKNNFFTKLLKYEINDKYLKYVNPNENPDILFYSIFGNNHKNIKANRKIFYSGEPFPQRNEADYNITFDSTDLNNTRIPLWVMYLNDYLLKKRTTSIYIPIKNNFCSFISAGEHKNNYRSTFVSKLSKYKTVDCGGPFLNNIGFVVPKGINCSGKIEHNNSYKFAIAFENEDYPGYVTEKICDIYKSNCIPIYWGSKKILEDFNPNTFINANDFDDFDKLIDYIIQVDNNNELYDSFFKETIFSNKWMNLFNDPNKLFYKNIVDNILGHGEKLFDNYFESENFDNKTKK
jgi:GR25 family glycosyltransferase involved in LPS biosynthesis